MTDARTSGRLIVTDRDRTLLENLYRFRLLPRDQAMKLAGFHSITRANTRLAGLVRTKLISRKTLPIIPGHGSAQALYYLGPKSTTILDAHRTAITAEIRRISRWDTRQVAHVLAANSVTIDFLSSVAADATCQLVSFRTETELRRVLLGRPLVPDGWLAWVHSGRRYNVFLELDLSNEGLGQWRRKVLDYISYLETGLHEQLFGFRSFRVIVLAKSSTRLETLRRASTHADRLFLFARLGAINAGTMLNATWLPVTGGPLIKLTEAG